jgi:hypothetical protein
MKLKIVVYSPLSLSQSFRLQFIAEQCKADVVFLSGTQWRGDEDSEHTVIRLPGGYSFVNFRWLRGAFTNKSAGVGIILGPRLGAKLITRIDAPKKSSGFAGRGGHVRLQNSWLDISLTVGYVNPITASGSAKKAQEEGATNDRLDPEQSRPEPEKIYVFGSRRF